VKLEKFLVKFKQSAGAQRNCDIAHF